VTSPPLHPAAETTARPRGLRRVLLAPATRIVALGLLLAAAITMALAADDLTIDALREVVGSAGVLGPVGYVAVYAAAATLLVPAAPFTVAAGVLFGPVTGVLTALVGATLGALGSFGLGRAVGRGAVTELAGARLASIDVFLERRGFASVLVLRLVPLFPFNVINLVSGVTGVRVGTYTAATALGIIPGTVVYAALGGTIEDPTSPAFLGAVAALLIVTIGGALAARRVRGRDVTETG
jgi:uncharacterized membrane protein YdjX (TVP38/TMEM64 family)